MTAEQPAADPEQRDLQQVDPPRIYVASLSDYNAGRLHGTWLDLAGKDFQAVQNAVTAMLNASPEVGAEEWAIHDYEGFGPVHLGEYEDLDHVVRLARGIQTHGPAFAHWAAFLGSSDRDELEHFDERYRGEWASIEDYAQEMLDDSGIDLEAIGPEWMRPYITFDLAAFARDLSYDLHVAETEQGVYVFDTS